MNFSMACDPIKAVQFQHLVVDEIRLLNVQSTQKRLHKVLVAAEFSFLFTHSVGRAMTTNFIR